MQYPYHPLVKKNLVFVFHVCCGCRIRFHVPPFCYILESFEFKQGRYRSTAVPLAGAGPHRTHDSTHRTQPPCAARKSVAAGRSTNHVHTPRAGGIDKQGGVRRFVRIGSPTRESRGTHSFACCRPRATPPLPAETSVQDARSREESYHGRGA